MLRSDAVQRFNMLPCRRIVAIPLVVACFWLDRGWAQWLSMALFVAAAVRLVHWAISRGAIRRSV